MIAQEVIDVSSGTTIRDNVLADSSMANARNEPRNAGQNSPHDAERKQLLFLVDHTLTIILYNQITFLPINPHKSAENPSFPVFLPCQTYKFAASRPRI
jgi:hypothetical protein